MKITSVEAIPLAVPARPRRSALGTFEKFEYGLVVVKTDEGIEGYGEICTLWDGLGSVQVAFVEKAFAPVLLGEDPTAIEKCLHKMRTLRPGAWPARAAVEMALFDIAGKAAGLPAYVFLGGRTRESVTLSRSISMDEPDVMAAEARDLVESGFSCVKIKIGRELDEDEAAVAAIREAVGREVDLRVDANMGWRTAKDAIRAIKALEPYHLHSVEQPLPPGDVAEMRMVRQSVDTPVMADESVWGPEDAWALLKANAVDILNVYVAESGGLTNSALIFRMAELSNVGCVVGAMPEMGIGTSAGVHLAVAMHNLTAPCDASGVMYHDHDVVNETFRLEGGEIWPLDGPGLGVTLNWDAIEGFRIQ